MPVQSILIPDDWELTRAKEWLAKHHYIFKKVRHEGKYWRFRQKLPNDRLSYTTIKLPNGILLVSQY